MAEDSTSPLLICYAFFFSFNFNVCVGCLRETERIDKQSHGGRAKYPSVLATERFCVVIYWKENYEAARVQHKESGKPCNTLWCCFFFSPNYCNQLTISLL